ETEKTSVEPPPLIVRRFDPGPSIDSAAEVPLSTKGPRPADSAIVCAVAKMPVVSNTIVFGAGLLRLAGLALVLTFAHSTAVLRAPASSESTAFVIRNDELAS